MVTSMLRRKILGLAKLRAMRPPPPTPDHDCRCACQDAPGASCGPCRGCGR